ncbi:MAG: hypothetical protein SWJ54_01825 [Cyanobacteriota bacterium]|nr:hypothetical protein [Cyanobacteriota bacterium]
MRPALEYWIGTGAILNSLKDNCSEKSARRKLKLQLQYLIFGNQTY